MEVYVWKEGMTSEEEANGAYWERNMLAMLLATFMNDTVRNVAGMAEIDPSYYPCGWYYDRYNKWKGWLRVISINNGAITFHIPDNFDIGSLPEIEPNWDGHTTLNKWNNVMELCGITPKGE